MRDIFTKEGAWHEFAEEHNRTAASSAESLDGAGSYTLAACHVASGIPIPSSVRLNTKRKKIGTHFKGLRSYFERGELSYEWTPTLVDYFRKFALRHTLDPDELIRNIILLTEKDRGGPAEQWAGPIRPAGPRPTLREGYLPGRSEFESACRRVAEVGKTVPVNAVLDGMEAAAVEAGLALRENWRELVENEIPTWVDSGDMNGKN